MATHRIFAGRSLRDIRGGRGLRQAELAAMLGISAAYLSQLENDDRPLTLALIDRLRALFPIEWQDVPQGDALPLQVALQNALSSPLLEGEIASAQVRRVAEQFPEFAQRFIALDGLYRQSVQRLAMLDEAVGTDQPAGGRLPWEEVRDWFHNANNYVDALDRGAEALAAQLAPDQPAPTIPAMVHWLERRGTTVDFRAGAPLRRFDPARGLLTLNAEQAAESQRFQLAWQIASLALEEKIAQIVKDAPLRTETARELLAVGLGNYAAGAMTMPYERFRAAAREVRHDVERLCWTFGATFEQVCHRLSTLQRPGARGTPMFFCRVDMAGNITKRHSATRLQFARFGGACPLWVVHEAVALPDRTLVQLAEMPDGVRYVSIARGLVKPTASWRRPPRRYAVALGCEAAFARDFIYADSISLEDKAMVVPIGASCRICPRDACDQRAYPPSDRDIAVSTSERGVVPYRIRGA